MNIRASEIDIVLHELRLPGCRIQTISQPAFPDLFLQIARDEDTRFWVRFSAQPGDTRLTRVDRGPARQKKEPRFSELLRARIGGARIRAAQQLGSERIVILDVAASGEDLSLIFRFWGGAANCFLCDGSGEIIDAMYRRPGRNEVSGGKLDLPVVATHEGPPGEVRPPRQEFLEAAEKPGLPWPDMPFNWALQSYYETIESLRRRKQRLARALSVLESRASLVESRIRGLQAKAEGEQNIDLWQRWGQVLSSRTGLRFAEGRKDLVIADDWWNPPAQLEIPVDPAKSFQENAERYFQLSRKAQSGKGRREEELAAFEAELADLNAALRKLVVADKASVKASGESATSAAAATATGSGGEAGAETAGDQGLPDELLDEILDRWGATETAKAGAGDRRPGSKKEPAPGLEFYSGGFRILVGRTSAENDELLRRHVRGNDLWLHCRNNPGGYVFIISRKGKTVPLEVLLDGAQLALRFSKVKESASADIHYTFVKYLRRVRDGKQGLVIPTQEKNLTVRSDKSALERIFGRGGE